MRMMSFGIFNTLKPVALKIAKDRDMENRKIAIIDEDNDFLGELGKVLTASGYAPIVVKDALSIVDISVRDRPDVILLELKIPQQNGRELVNEMNLVSQTQQIPIIGMSESFKEEILFIMNLFGIRRYLRKPFYPLDVISAIENVTAENKKLYTEREGV